MKLLLRAALLNRKHYTLLCITLLSMFLVTLASQMEMFSLGIIAKTGPDFFVLFGDQKNGKLEAVPSLTLSEVESKWQAMVSGPSLTREDAHAYMAQHGGVNLVQRIAHYLDSQFHISTHLMRLAAILVCVAVFKAVVLFTYRYFTQVIAIRVSRDLRQKYFEHIQSLPMSFYHEHDIGTLSSRAVGDAGVMAASINAMLINYIQTPFAILSTLVACFCISWQLSLVVFLGFPLIVIPIIVIAKKIKIIAKQMQRNQEGFASILIDFLSGILTVKVFAMEEFSLKKYREKNNHLAVLEEKNARYSLSSRPILHSVSSLFFVAVILSGLYLFQLGPAELLVFCGLLYVFYEPVKKFAEENNMIYRGIAAAERMYEVLDLVSPITDEPDAVEFAEFTDSIEFRNVSFRYQDEWVLRNLSFTIEKGKTVALVGPTGAGKTSIVQLLPRLYDVQEGEILIDGKPIKKYNQKSLRENMAFVPQKPFLFLDTVRANITFGRNFSEQEVENAAKKAHADEFILDLPDTYDFMLEESGKNLSGGQQQRLAIARALVKKAPILIMDEATSSLDTLSEARIKKAICELHGHLTQIIIAHRLTTIENADKIIYLEKGMKVAEGTRSELLKICPNFRHMWEAMVAVK